MYSGIKKGKQHKIRALLFIVFSCLFFYSSSAMAAIEIGPIGHHWLVYDTDCAPDDTSCVPSPTYVSPLPDTVLIGARVCNLSTTSSVTNLSVEFSWDPNNECAHPPSPYTGPYCRADRLWLESMVAGGTVIGSAAAWSYTETKNCDMQTVQSGGGCTAWTLPAAANAIEAVYWDRYDEMEEMVTYDTRNIDPVPAHCKDVYFNVSGDLAVLADLDGKGGGAGGSVPFQIKATGTDNGTVSDSLTDLYSGTPNRGSAPDQDPRVGDFGAAVASYEVFLDYRTPIGYYFTGPVSLPLQGDVVTYDFGWELNNLSSMFSTLDFPDDLYDIVHVRTEAWNSYSNFINHKDDTPPISRYFQLYVSNRNGLDNITVDDNWYDSNFHNVGTWAGWYGYGIGDPDGRRDGEGACSALTIPWWPSTNTHICNYKRQYSPTAAPPLDIPRVCYAQEQDCNLPSGTFLRSIYTVRAKRNMSPTDTMKWAMSYTEEGGFTYYFWVLVDEITYANVEDFRVYEGRRGAIVEWTTSSEDGTAGYNLYRQDDPDGEFEKINKKMLPAMPGGSGGVYTLKDRKAIGGQTYIYKLVEVEADGDDNSHGPYEVTVGPAMDQGVASALSSNQKNSVRPEKDAEFKHKARKLSKKSKKLNLQARESRKLAKAKKKKRSNKTVAKLKVDSPGLYHLSNTELATMLGVPAKRIKKLLRKNKISLMNKGETVPLFASKKGNDGAYFYGIGEESSYTDDNVYFLKKGRKHQGKQRVIKPSFFKKKPGNKYSSVDASFLATVHAEENKLAVTAFFTDPEDDFWMWDYQIGGYADFETRQYQIDVPDPASAGSAQLLVSLKGISQSPTNGSHHAVISLNGNFIGDVYFQNQESLEAELAFDPSLLINGTNTIEVYAAMDGGTTYSFFCVNSFDIQYERHYQARNEKLFFKGSDTARVQIAGFTSADLFVIDVTDPSSPRSLKSKVSTDPAGGYILTIASIRAEREYLAVSSAGLATVADYCSDVPSQLRKKRNTVDYLVIAPSELLDGARRLADYRTSLGMRTLVVDLEDVMDEFNFGIYSPEAIRDFMEYAYNNWTTAPQYLVLLGNGTYDYKNLLGYGDNLMPVRLVDIDAGLYSSDTYYVDVDGEDKIPELAVGRIPVRTAVELDSYIDKLIAMENTSGQLSRSKMLMIADKRTEKANFSVDSDGIAAFLPDSFENEKIYLDDMSLSEGRTRTVDAMNEGVGFVNFVGHSGVTQLGADGILTVADTEVLANAPFSPIMTWWTCVAGKFELPGYRSIAEELLFDADGGASAIFASSGLVDSADSQRLGKFFYDNVRSMEGATLGNIVLKSKQQYGAKSTTGLALLSFYNLLGDPAMPIQ